MKPFALQTRDLVLDEITAADAPLIARYCSEPVFERFMSTPWPYTTADADSFAGEYVPGAWRTGSEWTWAIRERTGSELLGVIGLRLPSGMLGFWLGSPHRGRQIMSAATEAVVAAAFARTDLEAVKWEAHVGNVASLRTAERAGFTYTGERPGSIPSRTGDPVQSWAAEIRRGEGQEPKPGWPA